MKAHLRYLRYVLRHKWFVLVAGLKVGAPVWRLLIHDWSKFMPIEWSAYVGKFYGSSPSSAAVDLAFDRAWLHHQHANPHHWQHWVLREDDGATKLLRIPESFLREMVADWMGAGRAITGRWEATDWYVKNRDRIQLDRGSRVRVERLLDCVCACGAYGSTRETCEEFGYCEVYMTKVPDRNVPTPPKRAPREGE